MQPSTKIFDAGDLDDVASQAFFHFDLVQAGIQPNTWPILALIGERSCSGSLFLGAEHHHDVLAGLDAGG